MQEPTFDILSGIAGRNAKWLESVPGLTNARGNAWKSLPLQRLQENTSSSTRGTVASLVQVEHGDETHFVESKSRQRRVANRRLRFPFRELSDHAVPTASS